METPDPPNTPFQGLQTGVFNTPWHLKDSWGGWWSIGFFTLGVIVIQFENRLVTLTNPKKE